MAQSLRLEPQGVFVLLWDAKEDLVRALLVLRAAFEDVPTRCLLLTPGTRSEAILREMIESRLGEFEGRPPGHLWFLFLQQASSKVVGPLLNGWRTPLRQAPGTILVIRRADYNAFQKDAPDLASFIGPRVYDASTMISVVSREVYKHLQPIVPSEFAVLLADLPGHDAR
jgi:hypothetical protein